jgi:hypothetical protein
VSTNKQKQNNMTTQKSIVKRPEDTYSASYKMCKNSIIEWRINNKEYVTQYNREYQRKLRQDPIKYNELKMRVMISRYLRGQSKNSFKVSSAMGMTREQLATNNNMTEAELINLLKTHEIDHIVSASWFNDSKNIHLKPYMYRAYNLQIVERKTNRNKHNFIDLTDLRVQLVITQLELDYENSVNKYTSESFDVIAELARKAKTLQTKVQNKFKN